MEFLVFLHTIGPGIAQFIFGAVIFIGFFGIIWKVLGGLLDAQTHDWEIDEKQQEDK